MNESQMILSDDPRPHIQRVRGEYVCTLPPWRAQWQNDWRVGVGSTPEAAYRDRERRGTLP